jgi:hypothetical protein
MVGAELVTFKVSATALAVKVSELVTFYRQKSVVNRAELEQLKWRADEALRLARARAVGDLSRVNIEEIAKTQYLIDSLNLSGTALYHAMMQLDHLSAALIKNLDGLSNA